MKDNKFDSVIVLSKDREPDGSLGEEFRARIDYGVDEYFNNSTRSLIMSGNHGLRERPFDSSHAEDMRDYAIKKGVAVKDIFLESESLDTVGQAVFTRRKIVVPENMNHLLVVSSNYHLGRVGIIFDFVFGNNGRLRYSSAYSSQIDPEILERERRGIDAFLSTFEGVERGNLEAIEERLISRHPLYKGFKLF